MLLGVGVELREVPGKKIQKLERLRNATFKGFLWFSFIYIYIKYVLFSKKLKIGGKCDLSPIFAQPENGKPVM